MLPLLQYHDVARMFELFGHPSTERIYIFNGVYDLKWQ